MLLRELEDLRLAEALARAIARVADAVGEENEQVSGRVPGPPNCGGPTFAHPQRWIGGGQSLERSIGTEHERVRMPGVGIPDLAGVPVDDRIESGDEHF